MSLLSIHYNVYYSHLIFKQKMNSKQTPTKKLEYLLGLQSTPRRPLSSTTHPNNDSLTTQSLQTLNTNFLKIISKITETNSLLNQKLNDLTFQQHRVVNKYMKTQNMTLCQQAEYITAKSYSIDQLYDECIEELENIDRMRKEEQRVMDEMIEQMEVQFMQKLYGVDENIQKMNKFDHHLCSLNSSKRKRLASELQCIKAEITESVQFGNIKQIQAMLEKQAIEMSRELNSVIDGRLCREQVIQ